MGLSAAPDGDRERIRLESQTGASQGIRTAKVMPPSHQHEFRDALDGMEIEFTRADAITITPKITASSLVRVIFQTQVEENSDGHRLRLRIIAADESNRGQAFRLDPNEICLLQKFPDMDKHDVRIDPRWDPKMHYLEFEGLRFGSKYVLVFTTDQSDVYAEVSRPGAPALSAR